MKTLEEIKKCKRLTVTISSDDGGAGIISMPTWKGTVIWSTGAGWNHVSVSPMKRSMMPSWDDMCRLKDIFFHDEEAVIQVHPPKAEYVNMMPNCLHLWQCKYKEMVLPPSCLVGIKRGQSVAEVDREIREAYEMAGEKYD